MLCVFVDVSFFLSCVEGVSVSSRSFICSPNNIKVNLRVLYPQIFACLVRVPTENVKQKQQAGVYGSLRESIRGIRATAGLRK